MGTVRTFSLGVKPQTQSPRRIYVYLPTGYEKSSRIYPVLYMFDGHNLFFDETATFGKCWGIKDYLDSHNIPLVVIGQDCSHIDENRILEYCPYPNRTARWFPKGTVSGERTAEWFVKKLKPACEKRFRIHSDRDQVGIAGSSMGGLMSAYMISAYNDVYSRAACVSTTMDVCHRDIMDLIENSSFLSNTRIYMDFGSNEVKPKKKFAEFVDHMLEMNHAFTEKGCHTFPNVVVNGWHSEATWETIFPLFLEFLYPELF